MTEIPTSKMNGLKLEDNDTENYSDAPIHKCTIYRDGAEIVRVWRKTIHPGIHHVRFTRFPQKYLSGSLKVHVSGPAVIKEVCETGVTCADSVPDFSTPKNSQRIEELSKKKRELQLQLEFLEKRLETWEAYRQVVLGKSQAPLSGLFSEGAFKDFGDFLWKYEGEYVRLNVAIDKAKDELQELEVKMSTKRSQLSNLSDLKIILDATTPSTISLTITYSVMYAEWRPQYDLRFRSPDNVLELTYMGWIMQWTGEEWIADQQMFVCGGHLPVSPHDIASQRRDSYKPKTKDRLANDSSETSSVIYQTKSAEESRDTEPFTIRIPEAVGFSSDRAVKLSLLTYQFDNIGWYYKCHPRLDSSVHLYAKFLNQAPMTLPAGPVTLYLDGNFVANIDLRTTYPFDQMEICLGPQSDVHVLAKPPQRTTKPTGSVTNGPSDESGLQVEAEYSREYEIKNERKKQISLILMDDIPASNNPCIKVSVLHPKVTKGEMDSGMTKHRVEVAALTTRTLKSVYKLEYPNKTSGNS